MKHLTPNTLTQNTGEPVWEGEKGVNAHQLQQRIDSWPNKLARGSHDKKFYPVKASFVEGGTIGPVPRVK